MKKIIEDSYQIAIDALAAAKNNINEDYELAVKTIVDGNKLIVSGVGKSGFIARKIAATFSSIGKKAFFLHPVEALHGDIGMVEDGDVAILLSKSGTTDDIVRLVPFLRSRNVKIIGITGKLNTYLANNSDIVFDGSVERESCPFDIAPTTSALLALMIGDALAVGTMHYTGMEVKDFARNHPLGQIGRNITLRVKDVMHRGEAMPAVDQTAGFKEAVLQITEKALGCVCIIDGNNELKGFLTDGDVRRAFEKYDDFKNLPVSDIMTKTPTTLNPDSFLGDALAIMENRKSQISVCPVVAQDGKCVGVLRLHDIILSGK
jgi:arabinose-5-phosphate isomerase